MRNESLMKAQYTDDDFVRQLEKRVTSHGGEVMFIQIYCEKEELLKRVTGESRRQFQKVRSGEGLLKALAGGDQVSAIDFATSVKVDSTNLTVEETVAKALAIIR